MEEKLVTARRLYTEEQIRDAWQQAYLLARDPWNFHEKFLVALRAGRKEKPVLLTKDDLLTVAATEHEKLMVHGIWGMLGTDILNEAALTLKAEQANLGGNMEILIRLAKARKEEGFQPGDVVRDANGRWYRRRKDGGTHPWEQFGTVAVTPDEWLKRPLEKM